MKPQVLSCDGKQVVTEQIKYAGYENRLAFKVPLLSERDEK